MKVFFSTSPKSKKNYRNEINRIFEFFEKQKEISLVDELIKNVEEEEFYAWPEEKKRSYYKNTIANIKKSDVCIFETSYPSLGVGHLISQAIQFGKPVLALYTEGKKPFMLESAENDKVALIEYNYNNLNSELSHGIEFAKDASDVRFNFFISPSIGNYLDWVANTKKIPRSVFLRSLIEKAIEEDSDYNH